MDENQTREQLIDGQLIKAGWNTKNYNQVVKEFGISKNPGKVYADYALMDSDGKVLAVIEAKKFSRSSRDGYYQALEYATLIGEQQGFYPFIFLSNGKQIQFSDLSNSPKKVKTFFSIRDLQRFKQLQKIQEPASSKKVNNEISGRTYQIQAIKTVTEGIDNGRKKFLLTMATGTGKTRTAMGLIDVLMRSHHVQKVLFLCDRKALRNQAYNDGFKEFFPAEPKTKIITGKTNHHARLFAATYHTMINYLDEFSSGFFDLIIVDEVHRSIYGKWKQILDHFYSYKVGLTATPVEYVERNTYKAFDCTEQDPTFSYPLDKAIKDGYLVPYHTLMARTRFQIQGIKGRQLPGHIKEQLEKEGKSPEEYNFEGEDINKKIENKGTNRAIVREFMERSLKGEDGLPGKTIIFAVNQLHAEKLQETFEELYPEYKDFSVVITSNVERSDIKYRDFRKTQRGKKYRVAISVDMLDTGVDIPNLLNLVFAKPVMSEAKFRQMIGRGTRLCPDVFGPGEDKTCFRILDFAMNFDENHEFSQPPKQPISLQQKLFEQKINLMKLFQNREDNKNYNKLQKQVLNMVDSLQENDETIEQKELLESIKSGKIFNNIAVNPYEQLQKIAPLMRYYDKNSVEELRFLVKTHSLKSQILKNEINEDTVNKIASDINSLPTNISKVEQKKDKIDNVLSEDYRQDIDIGKVEDIEKSFTGLMKYKKSTQKNIVVTDLKDEVIERRWIHYDEGKQMPSEKYWKEFVDKMESYARQHPVVQKALKGEKLTGNELYELENLFSDNELNMDIFNLRKAYGRPTASFRQLMDVALGVGDMPERENEVKKLFEKFTNENNFNSQQLMFLDILKSMLIQKQDVEFPDDFYSPMVENSMGINAFDRLFGEKEAESLKEFLEKFKL